VSYPFRWIPWNVEHIAQHGIAPAEAEYVVNHPLSGFPRGIDNDKVLVQGQTMEGRYVQVIYIFSPAGVVFVIHARPLNAPEKRNFRRRRR
jgi:uncharacterized protein